MHGDAASRSLAPPRAPQGFPPDGTPSPVPPWLRFAFTPRGAGARNALAKVYRVCQECEMRQKEMRRKVMDDSFERTRLAPAAEVDREVTCEGFREANPANDPCVRPGTAAGASVRQALAGRH